MPKAIAQAEGLGRRGPAFNPALKGRDQLRLLALRRHGGIYLDMDTLCLKPFSDLLEYPCVLGRQGLRPGLCNAVILSEPGGRFVSAWLASYRQFRGEKGTGAFCAKHPEGRSGKRVPSPFLNRYWDEHSVRVPSRLAERPELRDAVRVLDETAFFFPMWDNMEVIFEQDDVAPFVSCYCVHYWESVTKDRWLGRIDLEHIATVDSVFSRFARRHLEMV